MLDKKILHVPADRRRHMLLQILLRLVLRILLQLVSDILSESLLRLAVGMKS